MLTYTYDDTGNAPNVERSDVLFTFTSTTAGTFVYTYIEGGVTQHNAAGVASSSSMPIHRLRQCRLLALPGLWFRSVDHAM